MDNLFEIAKQLAFRHKLIIKLSFKRLFNAIEIYDIERYITDERIFDLFPELKIVKIDYGRIPNSTTIHRTNYWIYDKRTYDNIITFISKIHGYSYSRDFFENKFNNKKIKHIIMHGSGYGLNMKYLEEHLMKIKSLKLIDKDYYCHWGGYDTSAQYINSNITFRTTSNNIKTISSNDSDLIRKNKPHYLYVPTGLNKELTNEIKAHSLKIYEILQIPKWKYEHRLYLLEVKEFKNIPELICDPHILIIHNFHNGVDVIKLNPTVLYLGFVASVYDICDNIARMTNLKQVYFDKDCYGKEQKESILKKIPSAKFIDFLF